METDVIPKKRATWVKPVIRILSAGSAELRIGVTPDGPGTGRS
jgi:hypothetical protein